MPYSFAALHGRLTITVPERKFPEYLYFGNLC